MKFILLLISVVTLLTTAGCIFPGNRGGGGDRGDYRGRDDHHDDRRDGLERHDPEPEINVHIHPE